MENKNKEKERKTTTRKKKSRKETLRGRLYTFLRFETNSKDRLKQRRNKRENAWDNIHHRPTSNPLWKLHAFSYSAKWNFQVNKRMITKHTKTYVTFRSWGLLSGWQPKQICVRELPGWWWRHHSHKSIWQFEQTAKLFWLHSLPHPVHFIFESFGGIQAWEKWNHRNDSVHGRRNI